MTFGLITEGPTDQVVLRHLLSGYFSDPNIDVRPVQPNTDSSDAAAHFGGWKNVLNYCSSPDIVATLEANDHVIIQIDTDVCEEYGVKRRVDGNDLTDEQIIEKTKAVITASIGKELFDKFNHKIIFAVSYDSIECWLLPLYYTNNTKSKTTNCCETLNQELRKEGYTIDCSGKKVAYHQKVCKKIKTKELIESISAHNNSFKQFIHRLTSI